MSTRNRVDKALAALSYELRELSLSSSVPRLNGPPSALQFYRDFVSPNRPCIISSAVDNWPALQKWSNEYLHNKIGDTLVSVDLTPDGRGDAVVTDPKILKEFGCRVRKNEEFENGSSSELLGRSNYETSGFDEESNKTASNSKVENTNGEIRDQLSKVSQYRDENENENVSTKEKPNLDGEKWFVTPHESQIPFSNFLKLLRRTKEDKKSGCVPYAQHQNGSFVSEYSLLKDDAQMDIPWASEAFGCLPEAVNLWVGDERAVTSFHKDHYENLYVVISGEKHFTLLPPVDLPRMYMEEYPVARYHQNKDNVFEIVPEDPPRRVPWSAVDPYPKKGEISAAMEKFPLFFEGPPPILCTVKPGEMLYLPSMWFHHVRQSPDIEGRTIAINFWYDMQFDVKYSYFNLLQKLVEEGDSDEDEVL